MAQLNRMFLTTAILSLALFSVSAADYNNSLDQPNLVTGLLNTRPIEFTQNIGQWNDTVLFRTEASGATIWFTANGAFYQFNRVVQDSSSTESDPLSEPYEAGQRVPGSLETMMIKAAFVGANNNPDLFGEELLSHKSNYFFGNDLSKWATDIDNYSMIVYDAVYTGIDLKYYGNAFQMEYDFIVSPGADYSQIQIEYTGIVSMAVEADGRLLITTAWGEVTEERPVIYQEIDGERRTISGEYLLMSENSFGFSLNESYDPALPLIIDPILSYSSYLGGSASESGNSFELDDAGNIYLTGYTSSRNFPTYDPVQDSYSGGTWDVYLLKLNSVGDALIFSTYFGGSSDDISMGVGLDDNGNVYVGGWTNSTNLPTKNAFQDSRSGGADGFVAKFSSAGNVLEYATYCGGSADERVYGMTVDGSGHAYSVGWTKSENYPTYNAYYSAHRGGLFDAFVTKLSQSGSELVYSSYLGGSSPDLGRDIVVDELEQAFVLLQTHSNNVQTRNAFQGYRNGQNADAFILKLNAAGNDLINGTYLGGYGHEEPASIAIDSNGAAYIVGYTHSTNFPTKNPYQAQKNTPSDGNNVDLFVTKLSATGKSLEFSTYLGGNDTDLGNGITVDSHGNTYVTGFTTSTDFPTVDAFQASKDTSDFPDVFVAKFDPTGSALMYSSYLGGNGYDAGYDIEVNEQGDCYLTGRAHSTDFPVANAYQPIKAGGAGGSDIFLTRLSGLGVCCGLYTNGLTGNIDCSSDGKRNLVDITRLIDFIIIGHAALCCPVSGNVDGDFENKINLADITKLIDHVYIDRDETAACE